jgi:hypothetical protein
MTRVAGKVYGAEPEEISEGLEESPSERINSSGTTSATGG